MKVAVGGLTLVLLAGGCSSNQAASKASVTGADVAACHAFGDQWIVRGSTTTPAERIQLLGEVERADNADLRREGAALKAAVVGQQRDAERTIAQTLSRTCYGLGLISQSGQPT